MAPPCHPLRNAIALLLVPLLSLYGILHISAQILVNTEALPSDSPSEEQPPQPAPEVATDTNCCPPPPPSQPVAQPAPAQQDPNPQSSDEGQPDTDPPNLKKAHLPTTKSELAAYQAQAAQGTTLNTGNGFPDRPPWVYSMGDRSATDGTGQAAAAYPYATESEANILAALQAGTGTALLSSAAANQAPPAAAPPPQAPVAQPPPPSVAHTSPPPPDPWQELKQKGVRVITIGEYHLQPGTIAKEDAFLQSAHDRLGARYLVVEHPKDEQQALSRMIANPNYHNMARVEVGLDNPPQPVPEKDKQADANDVEPYLRAVDQSRSNPQLLARLNQHLQQVGRKPLTPEDIASLEASMQMFRMWADAGKMGYAVHAGDASRVGAKTLLTPDAMKTRNQVQAATIAADAGKAPVVAILGSEHTGMNATRTLPGNPDTWADTNRILLDQYHRLSISLNPATVVGVKGYLTARGQKDPLAKAPYSPAQLARIRTYHSQALAKDSFRTPTLDDDRGLDSPVYLRDAIHRMEKSVQPLLPKSSPSSAVP
ncbi:MAG: hypothetical protein AB7T14_00335 [Candidatus Methylacidiphilaceae bacterium]